MIRNYLEFVDALSGAGFSMGGGNDEGVFALICHDWKNTPADSPIHWHTGDPETDPWEWRMRVLEERDDIAYAKIFFRKSGYITKEWYPHFLAVRRQNKDFDRSYKDGKISHIAKEIYDIIREHGVLPAHALKQIGGFKKEDSSKFERALVDLQTRLFITLCGRQQRQSKTGDLYGWSSTVFCTTEMFWGEEVFNSASQITPEQGAENIMQQIRYLNPDADEKKAIKFILG